MMYITHLFKANISFFFLQRALARKWALQGGEEHDEHRLQSLQLDTGFEYAFSRPGEIKK